LRDDDRDALLNSSVFPAKISVMPCACGADASADAFAGHVTARDFHFPFGLFGALPRDVAAARGGLTGDKPEMSGGIFFEPMRKAFFSLRDLTHFLPAIAARRTSRSLF
jgi:hypothetical protein